MRPSSPVMRRLMVATLALAGLVLMGPGARSSSAVDTQPAPGSVRILYSSDWTGRAQIYAVDAARDGAVGQITSDAPTCQSGLLACGFAYPVPSPDGTRIAYFSARHLGAEGSLWIATANGFAPRKVTDGIAPGTDRSPAEMVAWSPDSSRLAYIKGGLHIVGADGSSDRLVASKATGTPVWSKNGRRVSTTLGIPSPDARWHAIPEYRWPSHSIVALEITGPNGRKLHLDAETVPTWSLDSRLLAFSRTDGIHLLDLRTGRTRRLTGDRGFQLAWSPDRRSIAYIQGTADRVGRLQSGDLRTVTLAGRVRTVVGAERAYGGRMISLAWVRQRATVRYREPDPALATRVAPEGLLAESPVQRIAADGGRVAYTACGRVFVWTIASGELLQTDPGLHAQGPHCSSRWDFVAFSIYDLALTGDRVAWGELAGNSGRTAWLGGSTLSTGQPFTLGRAHGSGGSHAWSGGVGELAGSATLLAFSSWVERYVDGVCCRIVTAEQAVRRAEASGCPCRALRTEPGPFVPFGVDRGRILAGGDNELLVLDASGAQLLSVPVRALAAGLSGADLVVLVQSQLRHYDAETGSLLHTWPLPDVPSGHRCGSMNAARCGPQPRLVLEDVGRGFVTYVLDGHVHLLRLADGVSDMVAPGASAGFVDVGLVYADGARLHLVPFDRLPLR